MTGLSPPLEMLAESETSDSKHIGKSSPKTIAGVAPISTVWFATIEQSLASVTVTLYVNVGCSSLSVGVVIWLTIVLSVSSQR